jgi:hypothetical protein
MKVLKKRKPFVLMLSSGIFNQLSTMSILEEQNEVFLNMWGLWKGNDYAFKLHLN